MGCTRSPFSGGLQCCAFCTGPVNPDVIRLRQMNRIAQWNVCASKRGDARRAVCVALHCPERDPKSEHGDYRTYAELDGIGKSKHIMGVNSMQSLVLAMRFLHLQIECAIHDGWIFFFDETDDEAFDLLDAVSPIKPSPGETGGSNEP